MKAYLTKDGVPGRREFDLPDRRPEPGDLYEWTSTAMTVGGDRYEVGDTLEIIEMTLDSPHGYHSSVGNWRCRTKFGVSVWTSVDESIAHNQLQLVQPGERGPRRTLWERLDEHES